MKRRLLNFLTMLSLLLCVAVLAVAVRGQWVAGGATFGPQNDRFTFRFTWRDGNLYTYFCPGHVTRFSLDGPRAHFGGIRCARGHSPGGVPVFSATTSQLHVWAAGLLLAVAPAWEGRRRLRERRRPPGTCAFCG